LGGSVESSNKREFGYAEMRARGHSELFRGIEDRRNGEGHGLLDVWMSHGDKVTELPAGFQASSAATRRPRSPRWPTRSASFYAVQFHPEVTHTLKGKEIIARFVRDICGCGRDWNMPDYVGEAVDQGFAPRSVQEEVILGLSGGVDSSVAAALIHKRHRRPADLRFRR
jgi:GMP synthase (glutamine-hydrolysing)